MSNEKVDLFKFLSKIDEIDLEYFHSLSDADKKSLAPVVLLRWISGTSNKTKVKYVNELLNPFVFNLYKHPDILFKLMMACSDGKKNKYKWYKKNKKTTNKPLSVDIIKRYYGCSFNQAKENLVLIDSDTLIEMAEELGDDAKTIKDLKKELK